ncbi:MAG: Peptidase inhibitor family [Pseudonocardiales bacterium]|jgi:hypothetical protein|nr:Peptidase inhibitor family [Pseudonocardiales bacterium]
MDIPADLADLDLDALIGMPIEQATAVVESEGGFVRVAAPGQAVTLDYRPDRVTLVVQDGIVVRQVGIG